MQIPRLVADPEQIVRSLGAVTPGMRVGDFGCGAGYYSVALAKAVGEEGRVTAFDVLESATSATKARATKEGLTNIDTVRANLEIPQSTGLGSGSLDAVLLANILFQSEKKDAILEEAKRVLVPSGSLIVIEWKDSAPMGPSGFRISQQELENLLAQKGFSKAKEFSVDPYHYGLLFRNS